MLGSRAETIEALKEKVAAFDTKPVLSGTDSDSAPPTGLLATPRGHLHEVFADTLVNTGAAFGFLDRLDFAYKTVVVALLATSALAAIVSGSAGSSARTQSGTSVPAERATQVSPTYRSTSRRARIRRSRRWRAPTRIGCGCSSRPARPSSSR